MYDFSPLFRSGIGFDRVIDMLENVSRFGPADGWPPYDIVKAGDDEYRITMAVAGFSPEELNITHQPNLVMVSGAKSGEDSGDYLHHGIAGRDFERRFELADYVNVTGASLVNGLLTIELKREIPEEMRPRRIEVVGNAPAPQAKQRRIGPEKKAA
jgi:molecular chaperone IbpA